MDQEFENLTTQSSPKNGVTVVDLVSDMSKVNMNAEHADTEANVDDAQNEQPARHLAIYPRPQMLKLYKSPLVKPPSGMPILKDWFGSENEQSMHHKKEGETSPTSARDRRFRRDPEDGEPPPRPTFRGAPTQPSQMGNFKHQSLRSTDRGDRDKDGDKERERDIRDKEGQEKLRSLSDKYDRDRLTLPSNSTSLRNKERDTAPHLNAGSSRLSGREPLNTTSRRSEPREGAKKKIEDRDDWRRGTELGRTARDDRPENSRRDREDRDRPRSRVRDISRPRRERSTSRRDRDREDYRRGDRDDFRRERDDYVRRDRDLDKDIDPDDPRRWRDDGKRDERVAARRDREYRERARDRPAREEGWEPSADRHGGRWTVVEERDSRSKRSSGRDRRSGILDEGKDKEDRRDRDREREKEPAWMDTYIPSTSGNSGGKGGEGELDGIQAFKKGMKAKEQKGAPEDVHEAANIDGSSESSKPEVASSADKPLDEIQLFKLMMKKEQEQKTPEKPKPSAEQLLTGPTLQEVESAASGGLKVKDHRKVSTPSNTENLPLSEAEPRSTLEQSATLSKPPSVLPTNETTLQSTSTTPQTLLSILSSVSSASGTAPSSASHSIATPTTPSVDSALPRQTSSRFFPKPTTSDVPSPITSDQGSSNSQAPPQFNPPPGSRFLALSNRNQTGASLSNTHQPSLQPSHGLQPPLEQQRSLQSSSDIFQSGGMSLPQSSDINHRPAISEAMRTQQGFSPFELQSRSNFASEDPRELGNYGHHADSLRRSAVTSPADRVPFSVASENGSNYSNVGGNHVSANSDSFSVNGQGPPFDPIISGSQFTSGKGSRFLKYFEEKGREGQPGGIRKPSGPVGFQSSSPNPGQRQDQGGFSGMPAGGHADNRTVDELFAMLNTSSQGPRGNSINQIGPPGGSHFGQHNNMQSLQQQQHQQMHQQQQQLLAPNNRLDSLYDSRLDDRNFVPDGMVPGLRQAPPPRSRENNGMFADPLDDPMQFNPHRLPPQQRGLDPNMFSGVAPSMYQGNVGRNTGLPLQQPHFRGNPSPNPLQGPGQQRLPPGLANLGGRPPHEPSQFIGSSIGMQQAGAMHGPGPVHGNGPSPQPFNNFGAGGGIGGNLGNLGGGLGGYVGNPQMRGPPPAHQLPNNLGHNQMGHLGNNIDMRGPTNQAQLLNLGGGPNIGGGLRGIGGFGLQQGPPGQMQVPLMAMRQQQQQQQHIPQHMMPPQAHNLPLHLHQQQQHHQQQQGLPAANTQELMALLMGGSHRD